MFAVRGFFLVFVVTTDLLIRSGFCSPTKRNSELVKFNCDLYNTCTSCVSPETDDFTCDWCVGKNKCRREPATSCAGDIFISGVTREGGSYRRGAGYCSRINVKTESSELLVPYASSIKGIQVEVENVAQQLIVQPTFICRFKIEGGYTNVTGHLLENTISCDPLIFMHKSAASNIRVPFDVVVVGGIGHTSRKLDNPTNFHLLVYRCSVMADDCDTCLVVDTKYGCGWCESTNRCTVQLQCVNGAGLWLNRTQICPEIKTFIATSRPLDGVNVTIDLDDGINPDDDNVSFTRESITESSIEFPLITICVAITSAVGILFAILILVVTNWLRKFKYNNQVIRSLQDKIETLELYVREPPIYSEIYPPSPFEINLTSL